MTTAGGCARSKRPTLPDADFVFFCGGPAQTERYADAAVGAGGVVIDLSQGLAGRDDVALVVPEVNADAVETAIDDGRDCVPAAGGDRARGRARRRSRRPCTCGGSR